MANRRSTIWVNGEWQKEETFFLRARLERASMRISRNHTQTQGKPEDIHRRLRGLSQAGENSGMSHNLVPILVHEVKSSCVQADAHLGSVSLPIWLRRAREILLLSRGVSASSCTRKGGRQARAF